MGLGEKNMVEKYKDHIEIGPGNENMADESVKRGGLTWLKEKMRWSQCPNSRKMGITTCTFPGMMPSCSVLLV